MKKGEIKPIDDINIAKDLLNAGYVEEIKDEVKKIEEKIEEEIKEEVKEVKKPKTSRKKK